MSSKQFIGKTLLENRSKSPEKSNNQTCSEKRIEICHSEGGYSYLKDEEDHRWLQDKGAYALCETNARYLLGRILTVIDASSGDEKQRKAIKDLIKQQFYEYYKHMTGIFLEGNMVIAPGEQGWPCGVTSKTYTEPEK